VRWSGERAILTAHGDHTITTDAILAGGSWTDVWAEWCIHDALRGTASDNVSGGVVRYVL